MCNAWVVLVGDADHFWPVFGGHVHGCMHVCLYVPCLMDIHMGGYVRGFVCACHVWIVLVIKGR